MNGKNNIFQNNESQNQYIGSDKSYFQYTYLVV